MQNHPSFSHAVHSGETITLKGATVFSKRQRRHVTCGAGETRRKQSKEDLPLQYWQEVQLRQALEKGRKKVEISQLCQDTKLERRRVLQWLKEPPAASMAIRISEEQQQTHQPWAVRTPKEGSFLPKSSRSFSTTAASDQDQSWSRRETYGLRSLADDSRQHQAKEGREVQGLRTGRRFNKAVLSTLETVYEQNTNPDDEIIYSIVDLHHVPKRQVVDWFAAKRQNSRREAKPLVKSDSHVRRRY